MAGFQPELEAAGASLQNASDTEDWIEAAIRRRQAARQNLREAYSKETLDLWERYRALVSELPELPPKPRGWWARRKWRKHPRLMLVVAIGLALAELDPSEEAVSRHFSVVTGWHKGLFSLETGVNRLRWLWEHASPVQRRRAERAFDTWFALGPRLV